MYFLLNGDRLNNIGHANDIVIFTDTINSLEDPMNRIKVVSSQFGLEVNISKTKFLVITKERGGRHDLMTK